MKTVIEIQGDNATYHRLARQLGVEAGVSHEQIESVEKELMSIGFDVSVTCVIPPEKSEVLLNYVKTVWMYEQDSCALCNELMINENNTCPQCQAEYIDGDNDEVWYVVGTSDMETPKFFKEYCVLTVSIIVEALKGMVSGLKEYGNVLTAQAETEGEDYIKYYLDAYAWRLNELSSLSGVRRVYKQGERK